MYSAWLPGALIPVATGILIVDDEPDITFTLRTVLEENGFKEVDV